MEGGVEWMTGRYCARASPAKPATAKLTGIRHIVPTFIMLWRWQRMK